MQTVSIVAAVAAGLTAVGGLSLDRPVAAAESRVAAAEYVVDAAHSSVLFKVDYQNVVPFYGRFNQVQGTYTIDFENPSSSAIDVTIPTESIDSNNAGRDDHLRGPDFFSAREFPTISFVGTSFESVDEDTMNVEGNLTLRGVTKPVSVELNWGGEGNDFRGGTRSGFEAVMTFDRSDFGVNYGVDNGVLGDATTVTVALTGMQR
ncbi:MAG: YceI family protein [Planctomycetota bacterium]